MIGKVLRSFKNGIGDGGSKEQRAVLFQGVCELYSLEDIEGFVDGHSRTIGQWGVDESGIDEECCGEEGEAESGGSSRQN